MGIREILRILFCVGAILVLGACGDIAANDSAASESEEIASFQCNQHDLDDQYRCLLSRAIMQEDVGRIRRLLQSPNVDPADTQVKICNLTYVSCALSRTRAPARAQILELLLQAGANPNHIRPGGTPDAFSLAGRGDHSDVDVVVETLLRHGLDPNLKAVTKDGTVIRYTHRNAYHCRYPRADSEKITWLRALELLLDAGAEILAVNDSNQNILHKVSYHTGLSSQVPVGSRCPDFAAMLLDRSPALMNMIDVDGHTPIDWTQLCHVPRTGCHSDLSKCYDIGDRMEMQTLLLSRGSPPVTLPNTSDPTIPCTARSH